MAQEQDVAPELLAAAQMALKLAALGPAAGPNPRVGAVILDASGSILATGYHRGAGTDHAEVDALKKLAPGQGRGATAVVTLEPCNHTGRTGPCSEALIQAGISEVYYSVADPGDASSGGAARLRKAGVKVHSGLLREEAEALNYRWLTAMRLGRPFITLKWASTLDGRIAAADGSSQWITGAAAREDVHLRRSESDAMLVGTGTALADNPSLTARMPDGSLYPQQPRPIVLGKRRLPADAAVFQHPREALFNDGDDLPGFLRELTEQEIRHLFVEGGGGIHSAFLKAGLVDEILVYLAPKLLGGPKLAIADLGITTITEVMDFQFTGMEQLGNDLLLTLRPSNNEQGE